MKNTSRANHINGTKSQSPQIKTSQHNCSPSPAPAESSSRVPSPCPFRLCNELESAATQSDALAYLFAEALFHKDDGTPADHIQAGLVELYAHTHRRLDRAVEAVRSQLTAHRQPKEVAS
jgi:hypothetical protein